MDINTLQRALADDLRKVFDNFSLRDSAGENRKINVFRQFIPIQNSADEDEDEQRPPEPYIQVRVSDGEIEEREERQTVSVVLLIGICDHDPNRQGYADALNMVEAIKLRYAANGVFGQSFEVKTPIRWAVSDEDTHPYYYAAVGFDVSAPPIYAEGMDI